MNIAVLTSSRADYGIYQPLLSYLKSDDEISLTLVVFGMHLLPEFGNTFRLIEDDGFDNVDKIEGMGSEDTAQSVVESYSQLIKTFGSYWVKNSFDLIFALGDRYEMSAAVQSLIPFNLKVAHIHGGETTLGATDNIYRHQISLASSIHFTATEQFAERVKRLIGSDKGVYNVGALSLDNIDRMELPNWSNVAKTFAIPLDQPFILVTVHPETVNVELNSAHVKELHGALITLCVKWNIVITLTNADAGGRLYREMAIQLKQEHPQSVYLVDNFGRLNYFAAMKASKFLLGNTSSGIIEAASMNKYVLNLGSRQEGRAQSDNVKDCSFKKDRIIDLAMKIAELGDYMGSNIYYRPGSARAILDLTKHHVSSR